MAKETKTKRVPEDRVRARAKADAPFIRQRLKEVEAEKAAKASKGKKDKK